MNRSSLFIFHESFKFRQLLIMTVINTENLTTKLPKSSKRKTAEVKEEVIGSEDKLSQRSMTESDDSFDDDLNSLPLSNAVYELPGMKIVDGKIITDKKTLRVSKWFENIILVLIILNSLVLVLDNPLDDPNGTISKIFIYLDMLFTVIFTIEAIMKIIAMGFFWNKLPGIGAYITNAWNILDFTIV